MSSAPSVGAECCPQEGLAGSEGLKAASAESPKSPGTPGMDVWLVLMEHESSR